MVSGYIGECSKINFSFYIIEWFKVFHVLPMLGQISWSPDTLYWEQHFCDTPDVYEQLKSNREGISDKRKSKVVL